MNSHLQMLPGVSTFSTRGLASGDAEELGRHTHRSRNLDVLAQSETLDFRADFSPPQNHTLLHGLHVGRNQSNTNAVHFLVDNFILLH